MFKILWLILVLSLTSCVMTKSQGEVISKDVNSLKNYVAAVENAQQINNNELLSKISLIDKKIAKFEKLLSVVRTHNAQYSIEQEKIQQEISKNKGKLEEIHYKLSSKKKQNNLKSKANKTKQVSLTVGNLKVPSGSKQHFKFAKNFYNNKDYNNAIKAFNLYVEKYKQLKNLADKAYYWRAESYYRRGKARKKRQHYNDDLKKAIFSYQQVITKYPKSTKKPKSLLHVGIILENLGFASDAKVFYKELLKIKSADKKLTSLAKAKLAAIAKNQDKTTSANASKQ